MQKEGLESETRWANVDWGRTSDRLELCRVGQLAVLCVPVLLVGLDVDHLRLNRCGQLC